MNKPTYEQLEIGISVLEAQIEQLKVPSKENVTKSMSIIIEYCDSNNCSVCPMRKPCNDFHYSPYTWEIK